MSTLPRVLTVDDNADFADNLKEILEDAGYQVRAAASCAAARKAAGEGFDVALVDVKLPDGDGTALAAELKQLTPDSEVVLLTGFATLESAAAAVRAGACAYLLKPVAPPELLLSLEQAMRQVRLHREKRELARRTQVAEKLAAVGTMTAGLSHEIRNPLNAAALQLSVLERRVKKLPGDQQGPLLEPLRVVQDEIRRLDHVLADFLQFARPVPFSPAAVDIARVLEKSSALFGADAQARGVALEVHCEPMPPLAGDAGRLQQVTVNLALNALEATPSGGKVRLTCKRQGDEAELWVEDSGPGIPADVLPRIFEPFFTTKAAGSGLGLAIVHAIVTQHGGTLSVENLPGGGARFTARLPLWKG